MKPWPLLRVWQLGPAVLAELVDLLLPRPTFSAPWSYRPAGTFWLADFERTGAGLVGKAAGRKRRGACRMRNGACGRRNGAWWLSLDRGNAVAITTTATRAGAAPWQGCRRRGDGGVTGRSHTSAPCWLGPAAIRRTPAHCPDGIRRTSSLGDCGRSRTADGPLREAPGSLVGDRGSWRWNRVHPSRLGLGSWLQSSLGRFGSPGHGFWRIGPGASGLREDQDYRISYQ